MCHQFESRNKTVVKTQSEFKELKVIARLFVSKKRKKRSFETIVVVFYHLMCYLYLQKYILTLYMFNISKKNIKLCCNIFYRERKKDNF